MKTSDISKLLEEHQTGVYQPTEDEQVNLNLPKRSASPRPGPAFGMFIEEDPRLPYGRDLSEEAAFSGWGASKYDEATFDPDANIENQRALNQSSLAKIGNGTVKMLGLTATTAVNTTAGLLNGLFAGLGELGEEIFTDKPFNVGNIIGAGVDNFTSRSVQRINDYMEELFPNYRTERQQSEEYQKEWYKHLGDANFWADSVIKNLGFTLGSMVGGIGLTTATKAIANRVLIGKAMQGIAAAAAGDAEAAAAMQNAKNLAGAAAGSIMTDAIIQQSVREAAKQVLKQPAKQMLLGSALQASGEAMSEGVMGKQEAVKEANLDLDNEMQQKVYDLEAEVAEKYSVMVPVMEGENLRYEKRITEEGQKYLNQRKEELAIEYQKRKEAINELGNRVASMTYIMNIPILTASNFFQFGKLYSGGWKSARNEVRIAGKTLIDRAEGTAKGAYKNAFGVGVTDFLKRTGSEAAEEMLQGAVSSGAKATMETRLTEFVDSGFDRRALNDYKDFLQSYLKGAGEYLGDIQNWQEGFVGMITGALPLGGKGTGFLGSIQAAQNSRATATALNSRINSEDFVSRWKAFGRHIAAGRDMTEAAINNDAYSWHYASDRQLISDIIAFANAGKLQDLIELVEFYSGISDSQAEENGSIEAVTSPANSNQVQNNPSAEVQKIRDNAAEIKEFIERYNNFYNDLSALAAPGTSQDHLEEMIATAMHIKAFETRFLSLFDEVLGKVGPIIRAFSEEDSKDESGTVDPAAAHARAKELYSYLVQFFTNPALPVDLTKETDRELFATVAALKTSIDRIEDAELQEKFEDMQKIYEDRHAFVKKLFGLQKMKPEEFEQQKKKPEDVVQEMQEEQEEEQRQQVEQQTGSLNTFQEIRDAYNATSVADRGMFIEGLRRKAGTNREIKKFLDFHDLSNIFFSYLDKIGYAPADMGSASPNMIRMVANYAQSHSDSQNTLRTLPDSVMPTYAQFGVFVARTNPALMAGGIPKNLYSDSIKAVRNAMAAAIQEHNATKSRNTMTPTPAPVAPAEETTSDTSGKDDQNPGSMAPAPKEPGQEAEKNGAKEAPAAPETEQREDNKPGEAEPQTADDSSESDTDQTGNEAQVNTDEEMEDNSSDEQPASTPEEAEPEEINYEVDDDAVIDEKPVAIPEDVHIIDKSTAEEEINDIKANSKGDAYDASDTYEGRIAYLQPAIPEIDTNQARNAREALLNRSRDDYMVCDLRDFNETPAGINYGQIYRALKSKNAFENLAKHVEVGDKVEFVILPNFYRYDPNVPTILMSVVKNGERYIFGDLPVSEKRSSGKSYLNLTSLRKAILDEYEQFIREHPGQEFVFSKKSEVFATRAGLIEYDEQYNDRPLIDAGYDKNYGSLVFIDKDGNPIVVGGDRSIDINQQLPSLSDPRANVRERNARGKLYYAVPSGDSFGSLIPIRLNVEHFNKENLTNPNVGNSDTFTKIKGICDRIALIVSNTNEENVRDQDKTMHDVLKDLVKYLDISDLAFSIRNFKRTGPAIRIWKAGTDSYKLIVAGDDLKKTAASIINSLASFDKSIQIRMAKGANTVDNLDNLISDGILTTHAVNVKPKGVNAYVLPWNGRKGEEGQFAPATELQKGILQKVEDNQQEKRQQNMSAMEKLQDDAEIQERQDEMPIHVTDIELEAPSVAATDTQAAQQKVGTSWESLTPSEKTIVETEGYTEEIWDMLSSKNQLEELYCLNARVIPKNVK